jgi:hypothetical protein
VKKKLRNYLMNNVDKAYSLIIDTDNVELSDDTTAFLMRLEKDLETFYEMVEREEELAND